eukprot:Skav233542  [mRNA]  locus=scaffold1523:150023:150744:- [translate_table: standard]
MEPAAQVSNLGHRDLMTEIGTKVSQRCTKFTPGQLAHITWAFGALSLKHEHLCDAVAKCCQADMARAHTPSTTPATTPMGPSSGVYGRDPANANSYNANSLTTLSFMGRTQGSVYLRGMPFWPYGPFEERS